MGHIVAVGTSVPEFVLSQEEAEGFAQEVFRDSYPNIERYLPVFKNTQVQSRHLSRPKEWFKSEPTFAQRNEAYIETACQLGEEAIQRCLASAELDMKDVDHLFFVSTSGLATPSIDARLISRMGISRHVKRTPIWGLGCSGGAAGLARAWEYVRAFPQSKALLLAVELCSLTFRRSDQSKSNLVATSLFGDGAAAVLLAGSEALDRNASYPRILDGLSTTWPDSLDIMGWEVADDGLKVVFSKDIPSLVQREVRPVAEQFLTQWDLSLKDINRLIAHPGGQKVLKAYKKALDLPNHLLDHAYSVLKDYGNMSSATVLFVLERELREEYRKGDHGLLMALGPGFSSEMLLLQW